MDLFRRHHIPVDKVAGCPYPAVEAVVGAHVGELDNPADVHIIPQMNLSYPVRPGAEVLQLLPFAHEHGQEHVLRQLLSFRRNGIPLARFIHGDSIIHKSIRYR